MRRLPILPTILVGLAVLTMIGLGVWQLRRAEWKNALLARYEAAQGLPPIAYPAVPTPDNPPLFRRSSAFCLQVIDWRATSGRNALGESGWAHVASCRRGREGPGLQAVMGWSKDPRPPAWRGGEVQGVIAPDARHVIRLVATTPAPGLQAVAPPSPADIPNNHLAYAVQWFFFAAAAALIYALAVRARLRRADG